MSKTAGLCLKANNTMKFYNIHTILAIVAIIGIVILILNEVFGEYHAIIRGALAFLIGIYYANFYKKLLEKDFAGLTIMHKPSLMRFTADKFYFECDEKIMITPYQEITLLENKDYFVFLQSLMLINPIPKKLFASADEINEFRSFINNSITNH